MNNKISIRFYKDCQVRAVWGEEQNKWFFSIVDIVEDMTMRQGDCMIETANGIFDCGIDTQLSAIKKRLTLLSYEGRD